MYARLGAFVCLSSVGLCSHLAEPVSPQLHPLVVFLKGADSQNPSALASAKQEIRKLMIPAGYAVEVRTRLDGQPVTGSLVVVEFRGQCLGDNPSFAGSTDLATTPVSAGRVLPFSRIHCGAITQILWPTLSGVRQPALRDAMLGRSLGRIIAHELYHILANETTHVDVGVAKTQFTSHDLLAPEFAFDEVALERISGELPTPALSDE